MKKFVAIILGIAFAVLASAGGAHADEYLFGFSSGDGNEKLILTTMSGAVVTLNTADFPRYGSSGLNQGWWSATSGNSDSNDNFFVGQLGSDKLNNFFTFTLNGLSSTDPVVSAQLSLNPFVGHSDSGRTDQLYSLFDVSTDPTTLNQNNGTNAAIFADLGSGKTYGSFSVPVSGPPNPVVFDLNSNGIDDINAALSGSGVFSIGGTLTPVIPEPASVTLLGIGLFSIVGYGWKRWTNAGA